MLKYFGERSWTPANYFEKQQNSDQLRDGEMHKWKGK